MSAESSGGIRSSASRTAWTISRSGSASASRISLSVIGDRPRHALDQVAAFDFHRQRLVERRGGTELELDLLGGALADQQVVRCGACTE